MATKSDKPLGNTPPAPGKDWKALYEDGTERYNELEQKFRDETGRLRKIIIGIASAAPVVGALGYLLGRGKEKEPEK